MGNDHGFGRASIPVRPSGTTLMMQAYLIDLSERTPPVSAAYVRMQRAALQRFATFMRANGAVHPADVTSDHLLAFRRYLTSAVSHRSGSLSATYQRQLLVGVRTWLGWLARQELIESTSWKHMRVPAVTRTPSPLTREELDALFAGLRTHRASPFVTHRREIILVLILGLGLRTSELRLLDLSQLLPASGDLVVRSPRGTSRLMPYGQTTARAVRAWIGVRARYATHEHGALVIDRSGRRISCAAIRQIVRDCGARAGLELNPRRLRETYGAVLLEAGFPGETTKLLLGVSTTRQPLAHGRL